jgi:hypothetical protein
MAAKELELPHVFPPEGKLQTIIDCGFMFVGTKE